MTEPHPEIVVADITSLDVDVIVNAANEQLEPGGGVCGAIHAAAGPGLARACRALGPCPTGEARMTPGFDLVARFVAHAVGPIYRGGSEGEAEALAACYRNCLESAHSLVARSIAFPCISTGIFGYPLLDAARIALHETCAWLRAGSEPRRIICCCFSEADAVAYHNLCAEH